MSRSLDPSQKRTQEDKNRAETGGGGDDSWFGREAKDVCRTEEEGTFTIFFLPIFS